MSILSSMFERKLISLARSVLIRDFSSINFTLKHCYELLEVEEGSGQEEIRNSYLRLVRKYHPDSGSECASTEKFLEIDQAFKCLISHIKTSEQTLNENIASIEYDIKHTAPQHRQYLSYDGYGSGNPFKREKQYIKHKAIKASQNVHKYRVEKLTGENALMKKETKKHDIKTKYGLDRLVEDLIQESMSKGEFTGLSGAGKPLDDKNARNPYVDFVTQKLNEVLINNGFTPEWITLGKEIREEIILLRKSLNESRGPLGRYPLNNEEDSKWQDIIIKHEKMVKDLNAKIDKFNLVVPMLEKQMFHFDLSKESEKVLRNGECCRCVQRETNMKQADGKILDDFGLFHLIYKVFKGS